MDIDVFCRLDRDTCSRRTSPGAGDCARCKASKPLLVGLARQRWHRDTECARSIRRSRIFVSKPVHIGLLIGVTVGTGAKPRLVEPVLEAKLTVEPTAAESAADYKGYVALHVFVLP